MDEVYVINQIIKDNDEDMVELVRGNISIITKPNELYDIPLGDLMKFGTMAVKNNIFEPSSSVYGTTKTTVFLNVTYDHHFEFIQNTFKIMSDDLFRQIALIYIPVCEDAVSGFGGFDCTCFSADGLIISQQFVTFGQLTRFIHEKLGYPDFKFIIHRSTTERSTDVVNEVI